MQLLPLRNLAVVTLLGVYISTASTGAAQGTATQAQLIEMVKRLPQEDVSNSERDRLVQQLSRGDVATVAPPILKIMREHIAADEPGMGPKPWMEDGHSHRAKVWYATAAVWDKLFYGQPDPAKAAVLLKLLDSEKDGYSHYRVLDAVQFHWNAAVEQAVFQLIERSDTSDGLKRKCLNFLLRFSGETYVPHAIRFIEQAPVKERLGNDQLGYFGGVFNIGNHFFSYSRANQDRIVNLGFTILEREARDDGNRGYSIATTLGFFVKAPNDFKPDQKDYQRPPGGPGGLTDAFFADTVKNALEWRKKNPPRAVDRPQSEKESK
jgi:hypothetical protein